MPLVDFYECMAYDQMEPFGGPRGDLQAGIIAATITNMLRDPKKGKAAVPADFMLFMEKAKPVKQTPKQFFDFLKTLTVRQEKGAKKKRG